MAWRYGMHYQATAAELALARGDLSRAKSYLEGCQTTARRTRSRRYIVKSQRLLAACYAAAGDMVASEEILAATVFQARHLGNPTQLWQALLAHGRALHSLGRREEAQAAWRSGVESLAPVMNTLPGDTRAAFSNSGLVSSLQELADT